MAIDKNFQKLVESFLSAGHQCVVFNGHVSS